MKPSLSTSNFKFRFAVNITLIFILVILGDRIIFYSVNYLFFKIRPNQRASKVLNAVNYKTDILILGSSRAVHHYDSRIIEEQTGYRTFNVGQDASTAIIDFAKLKIFLENYKPKMIIYDITAMTFLEKSLMHLYPLYSFATVKNIIDQQNFHNKILFSLFKSYRFNSIYLSLLQSCLKPDREFKGFIPLGGDLQKEPAMDSTPATIPIGSQEMLHYFKEILSICRSNRIPLYLFNSPRLNSGALGLPPEVVKFDPDIYYIDVNIFDYPEFQKKKYFRDRTHLNSIGAAAYSKMVVSFLNLNN